MSTSPEVVATKSYAESQHASLRKLLDELPLDDADAVICAVLDGRSRRRIANAYIAGWISAEEAMDLLLGCGLIEFDADLLAEVRAHG